MELNVGTNAKTIVVQQPVNAIQVSLHNSTIQSVTATVDTVTKTADYTVTTANNVILCNAVGGPFTVTLPTAVGYDGKHYTIKKIDISTNAVTVTGSGSETIDAETTQIIVRKNVSLTIVSDGTNWKII